MFIAPLVSILLVIVQFFEVLSISLQIAFQRHQWQSIWGNPHYYSTFCHADVAYITVPGWYKPISTSSSYPFVQLLRNPLFVFHINDDTVKWMSFESRWFCYPLLMLESYRTALILCFIHHFKVVGCNVGSCLSVNSTLSVFHFFISTSNITLQQQSFSSHRLKNL